MLDRSTDSDPAGSSLSSPVVNHVQLVRNRHEAHRQILDRLHDSPWPQVASRIIVSPDDQNARMVSADQKYQFVESFEIVVVVRE